jgi:hypothetical protein
MRRAPGSAPFTLCERKRIGSTIRFSPGSSPPEKSVSSIGVDGQKRNPTSIEISLASDLEINGSVEQSPGGNAKLWGQDHRRHILESGFSGQ